MNDDELYTKEELIKMIDRILQYYDVEKYYEDVRCGMRIIAKVFKMKIENPHKLHELGIPV